MLRPRRLLAFLTLGAVAGIVAACGDDGFIATNEIIDDASTSGGASGDGGSSGQSGSSGSTSTGGAAGGGSCTPGETLDLGTCEKCGTSRKTCDESGVWGEAVCDEQGECEAGAEESEACGNCGTRTRTCSSACTWEAFGACGGEGTCAPGAVAQDCMAAGAVDPCRERVCGNDCTWGACGKKAGAVCTWDNGTNFQCCGAGKWQFCSSASCDWHPCANCSSCGC